MTATVFAAAVLGSTDTQLSGLGASETLQVCLCCSEALTDGRKTRLCNGCFHSLAIDHARNHKIVCAAHGRRSIDPTVSGGW